MEEAVKMPFSKFYFLNEVNLQLKKWKKGRKKRAHRGQVYANNCPSVLCPALLAAPDCFRWLRAGHLRRQGWIPHQGHLLLLYDPFPLSKLSPSPLTRLQSEIIIATYKDVVKIKRENMNKMLTPKLCMY